MTEGTFRSWNLNGLLSVGQRTRKFKPRIEDFTIADRAWEVAKAHDVTGSQVALAWILGKPYVTAPIIGASKLGHLDQSIAALEIKLSPEEIKHLEELYQPHPVLGHS